MNLVTRGFGKRSGMLSTMGYGRRVIFYIEQFGGYFAAHSRVWAVDAPSRMWAYGLSDRAWEIVASGRSWAHAVRSRAWTTLTSSRSWMLSKVRAWTGTSNRSWRDDGD